MRFGTSRTWWPPLRSFIARCAQEAGCWCWKSPDRPGHWRRLLLKGYMRVVVPLMARVVARERQSPELWSYYWDTIEACVPPETVMAALRNAGFAQVQAPCRAGHLFRVHRNQTRMSLVRATLRTPARIRRRRAGRALRCAGHRRRPGRLHHRGAAGATGPAGGAGREGTSPALPHRRVAAAGQCRALRAAGRARAGRKNRHAEVGHRVRARPNTSYTQLRRVRRSLGQDQAVRRGRCGARNSTNCCSATPPHAAPARLRRLPRSAMCSSTPKARACGATLDDGTRRAVAHAVRRRCHRAATPCWPTSSSSKHKNPDTQQHGAVRPLSQCRRLEGKREGNISICWFEHGWFWFIPLADGTTSVGAVCWPYYLKSRDKPLKDFFYDTIALCPMLVDRLKDAHAGRRRGARHRQLLVHRSTHCHAASAT